jgi:hypothetical protein
MVKKISRFPNLKSVTFERGALTLFRMTLAGHFHSEQTSGQVRHVGCMELQ